MQTDNYEDVNNIPVNMKHQKRNKEREKTQNVTSDHMKEWLTLSEVQAAVSQYKTQEFSRTRWSHKGNVDTRGQFIYMKTLYNHSWSFRILSHKWREAINIPISFDKRTNSNCYI